MLTDYHRKYLESIKIYHQLHAELSAMTMKLTHRVKEMNIPPKNKEGLREIAYEGIDRIKEVDGKFRDLIRSNWEPQDDIMDLESMNMN